MSLNWAMLDATRNPVPLPNERTVLEISNADLSLTTPAGSKLSSTGKVVLTEQRLIFVSSNATEGEPLQSLSVPLLHVLSTSFQQPVFGANFFAFDIKPVTGGGLDAASSAGGNARAEIRLKDRGLQEFIGTLEKVRERAMYMRRESDDLEDSLPIYSSGGQGSNVDVRGPPPPPTATEDLPPGYED